MWEYFIYALIVLFLLSLIKIKGKRLINLRRFLFLLALFPVVLILVLFSSVILVLVLVMLVIIFIVTYIFMIFGRKKRFFKGRVTVLK